MGALPPIFIEFVGGTAGFSASVGVVKSELAGLQARNATTMSKFGAVTRAAFLGVAAAAIAYGAHAVHAAADFETAMTRVRTGAGESANNMKMVGNGVLEMAGQVGKSTEELTSSLYTVESAGYHGKAALDVLKIAAMGAKVGAAELPPVADALTTAMNAYKMSSDDASKAMNTLIATEANGKTNLEALASSMSKILPVSAAAKVGFQEVMGAMATMTAQGTSADVAATYLRQTIGSLSNPSGKAAQEMRGLGLDATKVAQDLGSHGLAYTLNELTDAIQKKLGPSGTVIVDTLRKASKGTDEYQKALANLKPSEQSQIGALATMVGGTKSMMGALQLTGPHMEDFRANVKKIGEQVEAGGKHVEGWAEVQKTFNQRLAEAKATTEAFGIKVGTVLMPYVSKAFDLFVKGTQWLAHHRQAVQLLGGAIGGLLVAGLVAATVAAWNFTAALLANPVTWLVIGVMALGAALIWLWNHWRSVWNWIKTETPIVATIFRVVWAGAMKAFHAVWDWAMKAVHAIVKWFDANVLTWLRARVAELTKWWSKNGTEMHVAWAYVWEMIKVSAQIAWDWISFGLKGLANLFRTIWDAISGVVKVAWAVISGIATYGIHLVLNAVKLGLDILTGHWGRVWGDLTHMVGQAFRDVESFLSGLASSIWGLLTSVGGDIIHGIISGIENAGDALKSSLKHLAAGALDEAKNFLGINSPSRVFAEHVGQWIPKGIAAGIEQHAPTMLGAIGKLSSAATGAFSLGAFEPAFAGGPGSMSRSQSVKHETHVHVTVQGTVTADRDLADTIKRVMLQDGARNRTTYQPFRR